MDEARREAKAPPLIGRRQWLRGLALGTLAIGSGVRAAISDEEPGPAVAEEPVLLDAIRDRAERASLPPFEVREGERYVILGTARGDYKRGALALCEQLADDYLAHFDAREFEVEAPGGRLPIVAVADAEEFWRFIGEELPPSINGVYELGSNCLVLFDGRGATTGTFHAERANRIALFHEATHQLTFNTGLLSRDADVPLAVSEGLAMYGEVRTANGRTKLGALNRERLAVIADAFRRQRPLLPIAQLIDDDQLFDDRDVGGETVQMAYAQSWLLTYGLIRNPRSAKGYRAFLEALLPIDRPESRLETARATLGDLDEIGDALGSYARRLIRG